MNRWLTGFAVGVLSWATLGLAQVAAAADERPNVVYIVADDLGYADIGFQNLSKDVKTPNIDAIAAGGVRFTSGYVSCPVCAPTRAGLMTGRYQQRFGFETNPGPNEADNFGLPTDQVTLAQALKDAGYATGMVGKWHLGFKPEMHPNRRGFDEFYGFLAGAHTYVQAGEGKNAVLRNDKPVGSVSYLTDDFGKEASAFVDKHGAARAKGGAEAKPFFLYLAFNAVHTPQQAPPKYLERFANTTDVKRKNLLAMLSAMDDAVGAVTQSLSKHGQEKNTLVVFHTDNGGPTGGNGSLNTPFRGFKGNVFEGGVRVPFAMRWPAKLPAGKVYDAPVIALDVFPTALAAAGAPAPKNVALDGVDLTPHLLGPSGQPTSPPHGQLFWRFGAGKWAVRDGDFKLVHPDAQAAAPELYDLSKDPGERKNLASEMPEKVAALQKQFDAWSSQMDKPRWNDSREKGGAKAGRGNRRERRAAAAKQAGGDATDLKDAK